MVDKLLTNYRYLYGSIKKDESGKVCTHVCLYSVLIFLQETPCGPFGHKALAKVIQGAAFHSSEGVARLDDDALNPMPFETIALAGTTVS